MLLTPLTLLFRLGLKRTYAAPTYAAPTTYSAAMSLTFFMENCTMKEVRAIQMLAPKMAAIVGGDGMEAAATLYRDDHQLFTRGATRH